MLLISNRFLGNIGLKNIAERDLVYVNGLSVPAQNTNGTQFAKYPPLKLQNKLNKFPMYIGLH